MRRLLVAVMLAMTLASALGAPANAQGDYDCSDFASQAAAQKYFFDFGGSPTNNVDGLDLDGDGWACERNPPPYFSGFNASQVNEGTPTDDDSPATELPKSGSGGYVSADRFPASPTLLLVGLIALGMTLISGGLVARRSLR